MAGEIVPSPGGVLATFFDYGVVLDLLAGVYDFLSGILPNDPIPALIGTLDPGLSTGIGWLNWIFPVQDCVTFLAVWISLLVGVAAAPKTKEIVKSVVGFLT